MRTLLVITRQAALTPALASVLDATKFQLISKEDVGDAEFLLARGAIDASILDVELTDARAIRSIDEVRSFAPSCPILIYTGSKQWEWEEDAYLKGVEHVLTKPVRGKLLNNLLSRLFPEQETKQSAAVYAHASDQVGSRPQAEPLRALEALRRFSGVLGHTLDPSELLKRFLLLLREVIGVNRAIVFLRRPAPLLNESPLAAEDRWLRSACCIGLDPQALHHFALSLGAGIGGYLHRQGRILRANSTEAQSNREITKEFQLLGAQVAIPIVDRQSLLGVAVLDERLTGEPYTNEDLSIIFHMLEEVGLAIRNSWLHGQLAANYSMIADILGHLGTGCMVIGSDLAVLHNNTAVAKILGLDQARTAPQFSDLPQQLGSSVFTVIKTGAPVPSSKHQFQHAPERQFRVSILPFPAQGTPGTNAALLLVDDITEHERAMRLDIEASNLRLVKSMAEHLAHEIGNSLVPLSTHQQLLSSSMSDPEFQESLSTALANGVRRISRLANQMVFLAREWDNQGGEVIPISELIVEAFHDAHTFHPGKKVAQLSFNKDVSPWRVAGDAKALRHAFSEIILNALQANPEDPNVAVKLEKTAADETRLNVEVRDSGKGFSMEAATRGAEPFFSTRNVGLGLGLTVTRKIIESHRGSLEIAPGTGPGVVRISLPLES
jgi:signal transduction histidine kinase/DNA-binding response OmpR family regulator